MHRILRGLVPLAVVGAFAAPAHATQTLAYVFAVSCDGSPTGSAGLTLPAGTYAVSVAGACLGDLTTQSVPVGPTPCTAPGVGPIPCVSQITTVNNVPTVFQGSTGAVYFNRNGVVANASCAGLYWVRLDGSFCLNQTAGTYYRNFSGPMTAQFVDTYYADNAGVLLVTVVWTPL